MHESNQIDNTLTDKERTGGLILVTGASGFLGGHLVKYLADRGKEVRALYNSNKPKDSLLALPDVEWMQCDLLDVYQVEEVMAGVQEIYHCAAIVSFHPAQKEKMLHFNVESTSNIVNEALVQGVRKMVFVSSVAALGRSELKKEISEEEQWEESKYGSTYGMSKHMAELEVWRGMGEGLTGVIINPGIILGEGNWEEGSARLMKVVDREFPFYTQGINAWSDVEDVVKIMVQLMECDISGERFIVSAGNYSYKEIFTMMANALDRRPPRIKAGTMLTALVWRWSMVRAKIFGETATITKETARTSQKQYFYNPEKLLKFLPEFRYTDMKSTIGRMAKAFKGE